MSRNEAPDHRLVQRIHAGEENARSELVDLLLPEVYRVCLGMLGNTHDAEDATQDAFVRVFRFLHHWDGRPLKPWVLTIAANVVPKPAHRSQGIWGIAPATGGASFKRWLCARAGGGDTGRVADFARGVPAGTGRSVLMSESILKPTDIVLPLELIAARRRFISLLIASTVPCRLL